MEILSVLAVFITPFMAGYIIKEIIKQKETSQIETYLIGFFFLFLLQGILFSFCVFTEKPFAFASMLMRYSLILIYCIAIILMGIRLVFAKHQIKQFKKMNKREVILSAFTIMVFLLLILRVCLLSDNMREDIMSETVRTTISTATMFKYHPLTGQAYESGLITSKKIITLPLYYAFWSSISGLSPNFLLDVVITIQTITMTFFASTVLTKTIYRNNKEKTFSFLVILGLLILSGDYFSSAVSTRLLWNGYAGDVICAVVMIPYLLNCVLSYYKTKKLGNQLAFREKICYLFKILLCMAASIFMTTIATGLMFLIIATLLAFCCCVLVSYGEGRKCTK